MDKAKFILISLLFIFVEEIRAGDCISPEKHLVVKNSLSIFTDNRERLGQQYEQELPKGVVFISCADKKGARYIPGQGYGLNKKSRVKYKLYFFPEETEKIKQSSLKNKSETLSLFSHPGLSSEEEANALNDLVQADNKRRQVGMKNPIGADSGVLFDITESVLVINPNKKERESGNVFRLYSKVKMQNYYAKFLDNCSYDDCWAEAKKMASLSRGINKGEKCEATEFMKELSLFSEIQGRLLGFPDKLKKTEELDSYFYKFRFCKVNYHQKYLDEYREYVRVAAKEFAVPEPLLSCMLFKESQWNTKAVSRSKAKGLGQFLPIAVKEVNYLRTKSSERARWENYFLSTGNKQKVKSFSDEFDPRQSVGAAALLTRHYLKSISNEIGDSITDDENTALDYLVSTAGAYNQGITKTINGIKDEKKGGNKISMEEIIKFLDKKTETKKHMDSIERCMTTGVMKDRLQGKEKNLCQKN